MSRQWLVVADEVRARIYAMAPGSELELIETLENVAALEHARDLRSDRPGSRTDSFGHRHALRDEENARHLAAASFAQEIAAYLATARRAREVDALTLIMPARFLGQLRNALDPECMELVRLIVRKDSLHGNDRDLRADLREALGAGR